MAAATHPKARGAFFTPPDLARFVANWAIRQAGDRVLEPSCGEAAFLLAAGRRLGEVGGRKGPRGRLRGVDIHSASVDAAQALLRSEGLSADISVGDFFDLPTETKFDAVVGNPPYIRYQTFSGHDRAKSQRAALAQGVRLPGLASSWAAFTVHASSFLRPNGRLGLVLPAELLTANYSAPVRRFLMSRFSSVRIILFEKRVFPGVLEEVVLLLAEGTGGTDHCAVYQATDAADLAEAPSRPWVPPDPAAKWTPALLDDNAYATYQDILAGTDFTVLQEWGETGLGIVTGRNKYFTVSEREARELGLPESELLPISPPGSRHLKGLAFTKAAWRELGKADLRVHLVYPDQDKPSAAALQWARAGMSQGVHRAYKCRVRTPWWSVPIVPKADLLLTYMNHQLPRLVTNRARVHHLNSLHGVYLKRGVRQLGRDILPLAMLNSLSLLGAELVGRSYGGGLLKLEPREADVWPMPSPALVDQAASELRALRPQVSSHLRQGRLDDVVRLVDRVLLIKALGLRYDRIQSLRSARARLFDRRAGRGGHRH